jgi:hypothetical protein
LQEVWAQKNEPAPVARIRIVQSCLVSFRMSLGDLTGSL